MSFTYFISLQRKFAGSISDEVAGIFHGLNHFGRSMSPGLTQPLTKASTRDLG
jgi:hypothetical protein